MSAVPQPQVIKEWIEADASIKVIFDWANVDEAHQASVAEKLGCELDEPASTAAMFKETEVEDLIAGGTDEGPYPLAAKGRLRRAFKAMRVVGGTEPPPAPTTPPVTSSKAGPPAEQITLNGVIVQTGEVKVDKLSQADIDSAFDRYEAKRGGPPAHRRQPTGDQLTAFEHTVNTKQDIYADLAVFCPDGEHLAEFLRLRGARFDADGTLVPVEIYGPPAPGEWKKAYDMAGTCVVCYDVMGLEFHDQYGD